MIHVYPTEELTLSGSTIPCAGPMSVKTGSLSKYMGITVLVANEIVTN